jgi:uncharacterized protein (DUF169 family)
MTDTNVVAQVETAISKAKAFENKVFAFLQAHYTKGAAAVVGFAVSHFGIISLILKAL